jgi:hypothetical protein
MLKISDSTSLCDYGGILSAPANKTKRYAFKILLKKEQVVLQRKCIIRKILAFMRITTSNADNKKLEEKNIKHKEAMLILQT